MRDTRPIVATDVSVVLGGVPILRGVDLTVRRGEVVALMGPNGSGKSTLVRALLGVVPARGHIEILGAPLGRGTPWHRIGYVPQRITASSGVPTTAVEVVISGLLHPRRLRPPRDATARALATLDLVGLARHAHRPVRDLSGGQQQRVLIARALVREPDLLLLDEPVSGVDRESQRTFATVLEDLHQHGTTIVVVLHGLGMLAPLIERAVRLRHGQVVHDGPPPQEALHRHVHPHASPERPEEVPTLRLEP